MATQSAPRPSIADAQQGFAGGLNSVSDPSEVGPNQMVRADNVRLSEYGAATKRGGTQRISTAALAVHAVKAGYAWRLNSTTVYGLVQCDAQIWRFTWGAFPRTFTSLGAAVDVASSMVAYRDGSANVVYIADGGALKKYDGTTYATVAAAVQPTGVTVYHDRLWGWGVSGSLDSVFYSALDNGDTLGVGASSGGQIIVRTMGQRDIVSCAVVNSSLMVWHRKGISRITGYGQNDTEVSPESVTSDAGLVGARALTIYDNVAYFVSDRGVFRCNETQVDPLSTPEKPDPVAAILQTLSAANLAAVTCTFNRRTKEVWVQLPTVGIYIYHTIIQAWSGPFIDGYLSPDTTAMFEMLDTNDQPFLCRGDSTGYVSQCEPSSIFKDNVLADGTGGTAYDSVIQCHRLYGSDDKTTAVGWIWCTVLATLAGSASAAINWSTLTNAGRFQIIGGGGSNVSWGSGTWGAGTWGAGGQSPFYVRLSGAGPFIDITITDSGQAAAAYASLQVSGAVYGRR